MRNKQIYLIVVISLLVLGYLYFISNDKVAIVENKQLIPTEIKMPESTQSKQQIDTIAEMTTVTKQPIKSDVESQVLSEKMTPFVVMETHKFCYRYFSSLKSSKNNYDILKRFNEKLSDYQKQYFDDYYAHCEQLNKDHPEYHLTEISKIKNQFDSSIENNLWNQIVKGDVEVESLTNPEIEGLITQNNLEILTKAPDFLRPYYEEVIHWGIEEVLQNRQYDYVNYILKNAHQLYLCDIGADCSAQSSTMAMYCFLTPESCGLDYPVFIETVLTFGQQQDIILAYNYLIGKYNVR